jgi:prepilin-type N-terminal cleavage/methylation domain-containing protein
MNQLKQQGATAGFSLVELLIAMTITLILMGVATSLLAAGFRIRSRGNAVTDAAADGQRALNIMSREIANAGFNLRTNGVVALDSDSSHLRIRSNLNKFDTTALPASRDGVIDAGEDVQYFVNPAGNTDYLVRYDVNAPPVNGEDRRKTVLANRLSSLRFYYFSQRVTYNTTTSVNGLTSCDISNFSSGQVAPNLASYIVIAVCVRIPAFGTPNSDGYQPESNVLLVSDVTLRNANLPAY